MSNVICYVFMCSVSGQLEVNSYENMSAQQIFPELNKRECKYNANLNMKKTSDFYRESKLSA